MTNIVIGAGSGIGVEVARLLAPRGRLILADVDDSQVAQLAGELDAEGVACDVTNSNHIDALVAKIDQLEALVITAGISGSMANGRRIFEVNLIGVGNVLASMEPLLAPGSVGVVFASMSGHRVPNRPELMEVLDNPLSHDFFDSLEGIGIDPDQSAFAYPASKRGIHRMVRRLCPIWAAKGARILSLSPGINDTPMNRLDESRHPIMADIIRDSPLGRRGTPIEVAYVADFLTSDRASLMTGSDVLVDGGMVAVLPDDTTGGRAGDKP